MNKNKIMQTLAKASGRIGMMAVLLGVFSLSVIALNVAEAQSTAPSQNSVFGLTQLTSMSFRSIANNASSVIVPIVEKANSMPQDPTKFSETSAVVGVQVSTYVDGRPMSASAAISGLAQNVFNVKTDSIDKNQVQANFTFALDPVTAKQAGLTLNSANIGVELRTFPVLGSKNRDLYVRVTNMTPQLLTMVNKMMASEKNKFKINTWYKISSAAKNTVALPIPSVPTTKTESLTRELEAVKLFSSNLILEKDFGTEYVGTYETRHFKLAFSAEGILNIFDGIMSGTKDQKTLSSMQNMRTDIQDALKSPELLAVIQGTKLDVWIGPKDSRLYKMELLGQNIVIPIDAPKPSSGSGMGQSSMQGTPTNIALSYQLVTSAKSINKPVTVVKPTVFVDLQKMIDAAKKEAEAKYKDAAAMATISNMRASAELYYATYGNSYSGMCYTPNTEFMRGYLDMQLKYATRESGVNSGYGTWCGAFDNHYLVSVKIAAGRYLCIDNTGYLGETKTNRALTVSSQCK